MAARVPVAQRHARSGPLLWLRMGLVILAGTLVFGGVVFALAGTWPVVVGIESGSMEPNIAAGDLVVLTAPGRFPPAATDTSLGVVTYRAGKEHQGGRPTRTTTRRPGSSRPFAPSGSSGSAGSCSRLGERGTDTRQPGVGLSYSNFQ